MKFGDWLVKKDEQLENWINNHHGKYLFGLIIIAFLMSFGAFSLLGVDKVGIMGSGFGVLFSSIFIGVDLTTHGGK